MPESRKSTPKPRSQPANPEQFEATLEELKALVTRMEQGQQPLETAVDDFEKGMALVTSCERALANAVQRIEKVMEQHGELKITQIPAPEQDQDS